MQDDFLDLAEDEHHVDMAMCLANGQPQTASFTNQAPSSGRDINEWVAKESKFSLWFANTVFPHIVSAETILFWI